MMMIMMLMMMMMMMVMMMMASYDDPCILNRRMIWWSSSMMLSKQTQWGRAIWKITKLSKRNRIWDCQVSFPMVVVIAQRLDRFPVDACSLANSNRRIGNHYFQVSQAIVPWQFWVEGPDRYCKSTLRWIYMVYLYMHWQLPHVAKKKQKTNCAVIPNEGSIYSSKQQFEGRSNSA